MYSVLILLWSFINWGNKNSTVVSVGSLTDRVLLLVHFSAVNLSKLNKVQKFVITVVYKVCNDSAKICKTITDEL